MTSLRQDLLFDHLVLVISTARTIIITELIIGAFKLVVLAVNSIFYDFSSRKLDNKNLNNQTFKYHWSFMVIIVIVNTMDCYD